MFTHEPNKDDTSRFANVNGESTWGPQPHTKIYRELKKAESGRNSPTQGRAHQLIIQY